MPRLIGHTVCSRSLDSTNCFFSVENCCCFWPILYTKLVYKLGQNSWTSSIVQGIFLTIKWTGLGGRVYEIKAFPASTAGSWSRRWPPRSCTTAACPRSCCNPSLRTRAMTRQHRFVFASPPVCLVTKQVFHVMSIKATTTV